MRSSSSIYSYTPMIIKLLWRQIGLYQDGWANWSNGISIISSKRLTSVSLCHFITGLQTSLRVVETATCSRWEVKIPLLLSGPPKVRSAPLRQRQWLAPLFGRFAGSKSQEVGRWAPAASRFIAYAPNFPFLLPAEFQRQARSGTRIWEQTPQQRVAVFCYGIYFGVRRNTG